MVESWKTVVRQFEVHDKNRDLVITPDEAPELFKDANFDADKSGDVSLKEWMYHETNLDEVKYSLGNIRGIFDDSLVKKGLSRFKEAGIKNKYNVLIYIGSAFIRSENDLDKDVNLHLPVISVLISLGFSQSEALDTVARIEKENVSEKIKDFDVALKDAGIASQKLRNDIVKKLLTNRNYKIFDEKENLCDSIKNLGCNEDEAAKLALYYANKGYVWEESIKALADKEKSDKIFSIVPADELKNMILEGISNDEKCIFSSLSPEFADAIDFLRQYGAEEATIKHILFEIIPSIENGPHVIVKAIPDVLDAFSLLNVRGNDNPAGELLRYLNSIDGKSNAFWTFHNLSDEVKWLNEKFKDKEYLTDIIGRAFLTPFSLKTFHRLYDAFSKLQGEDISDEDLASFIRRSDVGIGYHFYEDNIIKSLEAVESLKIENAKLKREFFITLALSFASNPKNFGPLHTVIEGLKNSNLSDEDILGLLSEIILSKSDAAPYNVLSAYEMFQHFGLDKMEPEKMLVYLKAALRNGGIDGALTAIRLDSSDFVKTIMTEANLEKIAAEFPPTGDGASEFWDFIIFVGNYKDDPENKRSLESYIELCKTARDKFGIVRFGRYDKKILEASMSGIRNKKHAFVSIARDDWNGAFYSVYSVRYDLKLLLENGYSIHIVEAKDEDEIYKALGEYPKGSIDLLFINGHGTPRLVGLTDKNKEDEKTAIDLGDDEWGKYLVSMKTGGQIIFASCSTGRGDDSIVHKFKEWAGDDKDIELLAPPEDVSSSLKINKDGKVDIEYRSDSGEIDPVRVLVRSSSN